MQSLDIISVNIWQILISLINLLIMFMILKKFLFKPVKKVVDARTEQVQGLYSDAEKSLQNANEMKSEYEQKLADARQEADSLIKTAAQTAQRRGDQIVEEAKSKASHEKQKAEAEIAQQKRQMLQDVRSEISGLAVDIASKVVEREINQQDYDRLVDDFLRNAGDEK